MQIKAFDPRTGRSQAIETDGAEVIGAIFVGDSTVLTWEETPVPNDLDKAYFRLLSSRNSGDGTYRYVGDFFFNDDNSIIKLMMTLAKKPDITLSANKVDIIMNVPR